MKIAIVHYHLRPGGVTRVIQNAVAALSDHADRTLVLTGEPPWPGIDKLGNVKVVAGLSYQSGHNPPNHEGDATDTSPPAQHTPSPARLVEQLEAAAREAFGSLPDIWHFHNHALGKNVSVPETVLRLARQGQRVLLQIHDFAEDGRPDNYRRLLHNVGRGNKTRLGALAYPVAPQVAYAVLNNRDSAFLRASGLPENQLHLLPNAVSLETPPSGLETTSRAPHEHLFLYPTRSIRRKNMGEFLLLSALAKPKEKFAVTLAPKNPAARPVYEHWTHLATSLQLPVKFEVGNRPGTSLASLMTQADAAVTTSVAEGFGLAFLEPWLAQRPLIGRNLPEITRDFETLGVDLSGLYRRLDIPVSWLGLDNIRHALEKALAETLAAYVRPFHQKDVDQTLDAWIVRDRVDFGKLDETLQEKIIRRVAASSKARQQLAEYQLGSIRTADETISQNQAAIQRGFGLESYGSKLISAYDDLLKKRPGPVDTLSAEKLLDCFLAPERFSLLRTS